MNPAFADNATASAAPRTWSSTTAPVSPRALRRITAIGRAEIRLFVRNPTVLATALLFAPVTVGLMSPLLGRDLTGPAFATFLVGMLATWSMLMVVYYNLTIIFVTRREEGVFQRMSTGEASPWEALIGACLPSAAVAVAQVVLGTAAAMAFMGMHSLANPLLMLVALAGGIVFLAATAAWSSTWTATVEGAQYSTMPLFLVLIVLSGSCLPAASMSAGMRAIAARSPLYAMSDLVSLGMTGTSLDGGITAEGFTGTLIAAGRPALCLACWCVAAWAIAGRTMRFARRR